VENRFQSLPFKRNLQRYTAACFAVAGPVVENTCNMTNLHWWGLCTSSRIQL
jgi:glucokinase